MQILQRYLLREVTRPLIVVFSLLFVIFAAYSTADLLSLAATGFLRADTVAILVALKTLVASEVLLPIAMFLTVVVGLGKLGVNRETTAMAACGFGHARVVGALSRLFVACAIIVGFLSMVARPWAYGMIYDLRAGAESVFDLRRLKAGEFYQSPEGDRVIYVGVAERGLDSLQDVFLWVDREEAPVVVLAREAGITLREDGGATVDFTEVKGYELDARRESVWMDSRELTYELAPEDIPIVGYKRKAARTLDLLASTDPEDLGELQWRISRPISTLLLGILATWLARGRPRRDRYGRVVLALLVYVAYNQLGVLARTWVEQGRVGEIPGVFWVDVLFALMVVVTLTPRLRRRIPIGARP